MDVVPDLLIALLQVNIASGFFYVGLQAARYRNRLYDRIVDLFNSKFSIYRSSLPERYSRQLRTDGEFSQAHYKVAMWIIELPSEYDSRLRRRIKKPFTGAQNTGQLPKIYRWYKSNYDRWATFALCSVVPILLIWYLALRGENDLSTSMTWVIIVTIFLGHVCAMSHVLIGWRIVVDKYQQEFSDALEYLIRAAPARRFPEQVTRFSTPSGDVRVPTRRPPPTRRPTPFGAQGPQSASPRDREPDPPNS